jgi:hypothetical protein
MQRQIRMINLKTLREMVAACLQYGRPTVLEIWGFHGAEHFDYGPGLPTFRNNLLPLSSRQNHLYLRGGGRKFCWHNLPDYSSKVHNAVLSRMEENGGNTVRVSGSGLGFEPGCSWVRIRRDTTVLACPIVCFHHQDTVWDCEIRRSAI